MAAPSAPPASLPTYLVTGGTGSFGTAFITHLLQHDLARRVIIYSRSEARQHAMRQALPDPRLDFFLGDVRDKARVRRACEARPDVVVHAAAMKHVPACEAAPDEAVLTNIIGTQHVRDAVIACGIPKALLISTDKAVEATTFYGKTKATAEGIFVRGNAYVGNRGCALACVRYGNVLASSGSVLTVWAQQRDRGEPLTITDPAMTRFWWTLDEVTRFVLRVVAEMQAGDIWVPDLPACSIGALADTVDPVRPRIAIGLRGGEKMHECLVSADEAAQTVELDGAYVIQPADPSWPYRMDQVTVPSGPGESWRVKHCPHVPVGWRYTSEDRCVPVRLESAHA